MAEHLIYFHHECVTEAGGGLVGGFVAVDVSKEATALSRAARVAVACNWPPEVRIFRSPEQNLAPDADCVAP